MLSANVRIGEGERLARIAGRGPAAVFLLPHGGGRIPGKAERRRRQFRHVHQAVRLRPDLADGVSVPDDVEPGVVPIDPDSRGRDDVVHGIVRVVVDERPVGEPLDRGSVGLEAQIVQNGGGLSDGAPVAIRDEPTVALLDRHDVLLDVPVDDAAHQRMVEAENPGAGRETRRADLIDFHPSDGRFGHERSATETLPERDAADSGMGCVARTGRAIGGTRVAAAVVRRRSGPRRALALLAIRRRRRRGRRIGRLRIDVDRLGGKRDEKEKREGAEAGEGADWSFHLTSSPGGWSRNWNGRRRSGGRPGRPGSSGRSARRSHPDGGSGAASARRAGTRRRSGSARA